MYLLDLGDVSKRKKLFLDRIFICNSLLLPLIPASQFGNHGTGVHAVHFASSETRTSAQILFIGKKPNERTYTVKKG